MDIHIDMFSRVHTPSTLPLIYAHESKPTHFIVNDSSIELYVEISRERPPLLHARPFPSVTCRPRLSISIHHRFTCYLERWSHPWAMPFFAHCLYDEDVCPIEPILFVVATHLIPVIWCMPWRDVGNLWGLALPLGNYLITHALASDSYLFPKTLSNNIDIAKSYGKCRSLGWFGTYGTKMRFVTI